MAHPHYGTLRDFRFETDVDDVRGANLYGRNDEKLGKIEDIVFDHGTGEVRYAVVDAGGWLSSNKFLVPANRIRAYKGDDFQVDLTKDQIERFPRYDENALERPDDWRNYEEQYEKHWADGPVMHREGSDRILTPEAGPGTVSGAGPGSGGDYTPDLTPERLAGKYPTTAPDPGKTTLRPSGTAARAEDAARSGIGSAREQFDTSVRTGSSLHASEDTRWDRFQQNLRSRRERMITGCRVCRGDKAA